MNNSIDCYIKAQMKILTELGIVRKNSEQYNMLLNILSGLGSELRIDNALLKLKCGDEKIEDVINRYKV